MHEHMKDSPIPVKIYHVHWCPLRIFQAIYLTSYHLIFITEPSLSGSSNRRLKIKAKTLKYSKSIFSNQNNILILEMRMFCSVMSQMLLTITSGSKIMWWQWLMTWCGSMYYEVEHKTGQKLSKVLVSHHFSAIVLIWCWQCTFNHAMQSYEYQG